MLLKSKLVLAVSLFIAISAYANYPATIINNSNNPWTVDVKDRNEHWFSVSYDLVSHSVIPAHSITNIDYMNSLEGRVKITDSNGTIKDFGYEIEYQGECDHKCRYIYHDGNTGAVSMNEPQDGSFTIDKDTW